MKVSPAVFTLLIVNGLALPAFLLTLTVGQMTADLSSRATFTELDRAGVINPAALAKFNPQYGFGTGDMSYRNSVPRFIAGEALSQLRVVGVVGTISALLNLILAIVLWAGPRRRALLARTTEPA